MNNDLNRAEAEEKKSLERQKMQFVEKRLARKFSNTFIQRLSLRRKNSELLASGIKTASEIHAIRLEEDLNIVSSSQIEAVKAPMQSLTRLRRANDSNFSGFNRKFHSSKIDNNIDESYFPEIEKREAQDKLLFLQLDAGVLPEAFIKPSADPNFLTVDLSNYGIGDDRGVCLGKRYFTCSCCYYNYNSNCFFLV